MSELYPEPVTDRLEELLNEIVAERMPVIEAERAKRERIDGIISEAKARSRLVIDGAKSACRERQERLGITHGAETIK